MHVVTHRSLQYSNTILRRLICDQESAELRDHVITLSNGFSGFGIYAFGCFRHSEIEMAKNSTLACVSSDQSFGDRHVRALAIASFPKVLKIYFGLNYCV